MTGLAALSTTIASRDAQLAQLLANTRQITGTLAANNSEFDALLADGNLLLNELAQRRTAIGQLLTGTQSLATQISGLVRDNETPTRADAAVVEHGFVGPETESGQPEPGSRAGRPVLPADRQHDGQWPLAGLVRVRGRAAVVPAAGQRTADWLRAAQKRRQLMTAGRWRVLAAAGVVVLLVLTAAVWWVFADVKAKHITAYFTQTVGVYPGSDLRILGVRVGTVNTVTPAGTEVRVTMTLDGDVDAPAANAGAVVVSPSVVADRYVQLSPAYTGGAPMSDGAVIPITRTATPLEIDQLYASLTKLSDALGPHGANSKGALSDLLNTSAANLDGNGAALGTMISQLGKATRTLAGSKDDFFGTVTNLQQFTGMLRDNDANVRAVQQQLATVGGFLAADRQDLSNALKTLATALTQIRSYVYPDPPGRAQVQCGRSRPDHRDPGRATGVAGRDAGHRAARVDQPGGRVQPEHPHAGRPGQPERDQHGTTAIAAHPGAGRQEPGAAAAVAHGWPGLRLGRREMTAGTLRKLSVLLVAVLAGALLASCGSGGYKGIYDLPLPGGADLGAHPYRITAQFADVLDLVPQSAVKVNEVAVGRVESIDLPTNGWTANLTLLINANVKLPADSYAWLEQSSLLGEKYVELGAPPGQPGTGRLVNNATIPLDRTNRNPSVEEVLGALSMLLNGGGIGQIQTITRELNSALSGNEPQIRSLLANLNTLATSLNAHRQDITDALTALDKLSHTLANQRQEISRGVLQSLPPGLQAINQQRPDLVRMLTALNSLSSVAVDTIKRSKNDLVADLKALEPTLRQLAASGQALPQSLQVLFTYPFTDYSLNAIRGDYLNVYLSVVAAPGTVLIPPVLPAAPTDPNPSNAANNAVPLPLPPVNPTTTGQTFGPPSQSPPGRPGGKPKPSGSGSSSPSGSAPSSGSPSPSGGSPSPTGSP
ncbi:MCE family protein [Fodinicola feengrottensis]|uniref:MCE family protein n=1 Tax=Fodinicola feengrottensis TaxID=435914 RepID=UPI002442C7C4|nr:MCE family protein [Fodinicola feengrottensis]